MSLTGDQCNRLHNRPTMSQTLLLSHMCACTTWNVRRGLLQGTGCGCASARYPNTPESLALANDEPWDDDMPPGDSPNSDTSNHWRYDRAQAHLEAFYVEVRAPVPLKRATGRSFGVPKCQKPEVFLELANYGEIEVWVPL